MARNQWREWLKEPASKSDWIIGAALLALVIFLMSTLMLMWRF